MTFKDYILISCSYHHFYYPNFWNRVIISDCPNFWPWNDLICWHCIVFFISFLPDSVAISTLYSNSVKNSTHFLIQSSPFIYYFFTQIDSHFIFCFLLSRFHYNFVCFILSHFYFHFYFVLVYLFILEWYWNWIIVINLGCYYLHDMFFSYHLMIFLVFDWNLF